MAKEEVKEKKVKLPTALKRDIQHEKRRERNKAFKSQVKTAIRSLRETAPSEASIVAEKLNTVYSLMDKGVKRGVFKKNKASRTKSRLAIALKKTA